VTGERSRRILTLCSCWATLDGLALSFAEAPDFTMQLNQAHEAMRSGPAKSYYEGAFNKAFYGFLRLAQPLHPQTSQALSDLDLLITLDPQGKAAAMRFRPESGLSDASAVKKERSAPPSAGLVVPAGIRVRSSSHSGCRPTRVEATKPKYIGACSLTQCSADKWRVRSERRAAGSGCPSRASS
jgi:hypothetical protein